MVAELMPAVGEAVRDLGERIREDRYEDTQASLRTYRDGAEQVLQHARSSQIDSVIPKCVFEALQRGVDAGFGDEDLAALINVFRRLKGGSNLNG